MQQYVLRRVVLMVPTLLFVSIVVFSLIRLIPGDIVTIMFQENQYAESAQAMREKLGLSRPFHEQYVLWIGDMLRGNWGESLWTRRTVVDELRWRVPVSLELGIFALVVSVMMALPIGVISALRQDSWIDYLCRSTAIALLAVPGFWMATLIITYSSIWFKWTPSLEFAPFDKDPLSNLSQFFLPALIMGSAMSGTLMRMTRAMMLEVLRQDYVRTAWAKGLTERLVVNRHVLKNAMIPIVTILGMQVPVVIGGSVIMETMFNLPGMGSFMLDIINRRDYPVLQSINLVFASFIVFTNLAVDVTYGYLDPRIRYG